MHQGLRHFIDNTGFPPRWYLAAGWTEADSHDWIHLASDLCIVTISFAVACIVAWLMLHRSRQDDAFPKRFWIALSLVFASYGALHLVESRLFSPPNDDLVAILKALVILVVLISVVVLARSLPQVLSLKTPERLQAEIRKHNQAEAKLALEQNLLSRLMDHLPDLIYFKDLSGKYLRISRSLADNLGVNDMLDVIGKSESDYLDGEKTNEADDALVLETGQPIIGQVERAPWDAENETWISTSRLPLRDSNDSVLGTFGISHDITPIKRTEEKLAALAHQLALPRETNDGDRQPLKLSQFCLQDMITCGSDIRAMGLKARSRPELERNIVEYLYRRIRDDHGQPAFALVRMFQTMPVSDLDDERQSIALSAARNRELKPEARCLVLRGTVGTDPAWNDATRSAGHRVIPLESAKDVEQFPMIAQMLRQLGFDIGGIVKGEEQVSMNEIAANVFHVEQAKGSKFIPSQDNFVVPHNIESVVGFGGSLSGGDLFVVIGFSRVLIDHQTAVLFSHLSISTKLALLALEPPGDEVESQIQAVDTLLQNYEHVVCDQENRLQSTMAELEEARDVADSANRAKSEFLANMSHEIRTPMNAIIGMTELVLEGEVSQTERDYLSTVLESGESLLDIINEVLDFSKIEAGKVQLESRDFEIREELGDMLRSLAIRADRKHIELACEVDPDVPSFLRADLARLRQVVVNLTGNAIKFTDHGEVVVRVEVLESSDRSVRLRFMVKDTGIGIPESQRDKIFDAFSQADASTTRVHGGTGLGLAISANIIRVMGGKIEVQSEVGQGSEFSFAITVPKVDQPPTSLPHPIEALRGVSVLLVDDNHAALQILERLLSSWEMKPIAVTSAAEALNTLEQISRQSQPLPIVVTDVHMPELSGYQMVEQIRDNEAFADVRVIILNSGASPEDAMKFRDLRVSSQIMKPIKHSELQCAVLMTQVEAGAGLPVQVLSRKGPKTSDTERFDSLSQKPLHILLVEDGDANQRLALGMLNRWGHTVEIAPDGAVAVEMYKQRTFDLVLMDIQMPVMDGLEATKRIREIEADSGKHIPIIAMTAHALVGDRERCLESGMDHYVSKPIRRQHLAEAIQSLFGSNDQIFSTQYAATASQESKQDLGPIDLSDVLEIMEGDLSILIPVLKAFVREAPTLLQRLEVALQANDREGVHRAAHTLKGNFRILRQSDQEQRWAFVEELASDGRLDEIGEPTRMARQATLETLEKLHQYLESYAAA